MKHQTKKCLIAALCLFLTLTVLCLSMEGGHTCQGEDCPVCACLHQLMLGAVLLCVVLCGVLLLPVNEGVHKAVSVPTGWAFSAQKERLND